MEFIPKSDYIKHQGKHLKNLRETAKISQSELAQQLEVDRQTVNRIEKGKTNPNSYYLNKVSECLNIPRSKVLDFEISTDIPKS